MVGAAVAEGRTVLAVQTIGRNEGELRSLALLVPTDKLADLAFAPLLNSDSSRRMYGYS